MSNRNEIVESTATCRSVKEEPVDGDDYQAWHPMLQLLWNLTWNLANLMNVFNVVGVKNHLRFQQRSRKSFSKSRLFEIVSQFDAESIERLVNDNQASIIESSKAFALTDLVSILRYSRRCWFKIQEFDISIQFTKCQWKKFLCPCPRIIPVQNVMPIIQVLHKRSQNFTREATTKKNVDYRTNISHFLFLFYSKAEASQSIRIVHKVNKVIDKLDLKHETLILPSIMSTRSFTID